MSVFPESVVSESRVLLHDIRWETYERLLEDLGDRPIRKVFDRGELEIVTPSFRHERWASLVARLVGAIVDELGIPIVSGGATLLKRADLQRGVEPDACFWIASEPALRGRFEHDALADPPPDLVLESEASRSLLPRLPLLAALGVPEVWCFDGPALRIQVLGDDGSYAEQVASRSFPWLRVEALREQLAAAVDSDETAWLRAVRAWLRDRVLEP